MSIRPAILGLLVAATPSLALSQTVAKPPSAPTAAPAPSSANARPAASSGSVGQYSSQSDATAKCSGDTVVWASGSSKALHPSGDRYFGKTKHGFYTCEKDAMAAGYHMAGHHKKHVAKTA